MLNILRGLGYQNLHGIEVSETSIQLARHKGIVCEKYDGNTFPFDDAIFDLVGSINVLEHTDDPKLFLDEEYRILKSGGHLVVICPNFLSVTNNYHKQTRGILQKMENLAHLIMSILTRSTTFRKMEMTISQHFQPDDDAVNITNPIAIKSWADSKSLKLVYSSAFQVEKGKMLSLIDKTPLSVFFGSCFFVFQKN